MLKKIDKWAIVIIVVVAFSFCAALAILVQGELVLKLGILQDDDRIELYLTKGNGK